MSNRALRKLTKSQKKRARSIREEIEWLEDSAHKHPFSIPVKGEAYRQACIFKLKTELDEIYANREQPPDLGIEVSEEIQTEESNG